MADGGGCPRVRATSAPKSTSARCLGEGWFARVPGTIPGGLPEVRLRSGLSTWEATTVATIFRSSWLRHPLSPRPWEPDPS